MPTAPATTQKTHTSNPRGAIKTTEKVLKVVEQLKVVHQQVDEPRDAVYRDLSHPRLTPRARQFIKRHCAGQLYEHQALALESILDGQDTLTTTPTASGKTLPSVLAALLAMEEDPESTALFIYPQKALAADQLTKMESMYHQYFDRYPEEWSIARYDGSVGEPARKAVRDRGQIILTNPDMLHRSLLGNARCWTRLLSNLKYIVIDEGRRPP